MYELMVLARFPYADDASRINDGRPEPPPPDVLARYRGFDGYPADIGVDQTWWMPVDEGLDCHHLVLLMAGVMESLSEGLEQDVLILRRQLGALVKHDGNHAVDLRPFIPLGWDVGTANETEGVYSLILQEVLAGWSPVIRGLAPLLNESLLAPDIETCQWIESEWRKADTPRAPLEHIEIVQVYGIRKIRRGHA